jgi:predicted nucleic acid-binding protein
MIVVDTNVWSEATKPSPEPVVQTWAAKHADELYLAVVVIAELRAGIAVLPEGRKRAALATQIETIVDRFADRILPFDEPASRHYADIVARSKRTGRPIMTADAMIAATALAAGMRLATRDEDDFAAAEIELINPWNP